LGHYCVEIDQRVGTKTSGKTHQVILPVFIQIGRTDSASGTLMRFRFSIVNLPCQSLDYISDADGIDRASPLALERGLMRACPSTTRGVMNLTAGRWNQCPDAFFQVHHRKLVLLVGHPSPIC